MDQLAPQHVPIYETGQKRRQIWEQCQTQGQPVIAIREAARGYIVRYDLQHLDAELSEKALGTLRKMVRDARSYPTAGNCSPTGTDPISETEGVGGDAGVISGDLHAKTEQRARELASRLSGVIFDRQRWQ